MHGKLGHLTNFQLSGGINLSFFEAVILGIVQGLTEFLPVSSSGHLELGKALLGDTSIPQESMMFTIVVHFATTLATLVVYRSEVSDIAKGLMLRQNNDEFKFSVKILISIIPAAAIGILFSKELETLFTQQILLVGIMLWITGILLIIADQSKSTSKEVTSKDAVIIGIAQAIAILPGISRSGATISTSVILGIDRNNAARFSFLMVVPLILGKIAKDMFDGNLHINDDQISILTAGFLAAFITGLFACQWMIKLVRNAQLKNFSYYCFAIGTAAIALQF